ncbi:MAG: Rpn family recombination-promoting nuclease/putative transposase [Bacteroidales bacterium]|nr:Rpn family recombination-promoting nuclease/putative transposase [Bacteroidales bacterium]
MSKYLNPKADLTFKKVFGEHKNLVISLLNSLLPLPEGMEIKSVEYLNPENHNGNTKDKYSIVDVKCTDNYGRTFVVEMQNYWTTAFFSRTLYNAVFTYSNQLRRGETFETLKEVYALSLVNESEIKTADCNKEDIIHEYYLTNTHNPEDIHKDIALIFVDLQKYKTLGKPLNKGANKIADLWLKFLTEIDDYTIDADPQLLNNPETSEALEIVEQAAYSAQELEAYNKYWLDISTERSALLEYEEKGRVEGREEGRVEEKIKNAQKMKSKGYPIEDISEITGLSKDEIEKL